MEETEALIPEEMDTTFKDKFLVGQKMFRLATLDVLSSIREAFLPIGIEEGEHLLPDAGRKWLVSRALVVKKTLQ